MAFAVISPGHYGTVIFEGKYMLIPGDYFNHIGQPSRDAKLAKIVAPPTNYGTIVFECHCKMTAAINCNDIALGRNRDGCFTVGVFAPGIDPSINTEGEGHGHTCADIFEAHVFEVSRDGSFIMAIVAPRHNGIVLEQGNHVGVAYCCLTQ